MGQQPRQQPRLLDHLLIVYRRRHFSRSTESAYLYCVRLLLLLYGKRYPGEGAG